MEESKGLFEEFHLLETSPCINVLTQGKQENERGWFTESFDVNNKGDLIFYFYWNISSGKFTINGNEPNLIVCMFSLETFSEDKEKQYI